MPAHKDTRAHKSQPGRRGQVTGYEASFGKRRGFKEATPMLAMFEFASTTGSLHKIRTSTMVRIICILRVVLWMVFAATPTLQAQERSADRPHPVWVMGNGFHTSLALRTSDAGPLLRHAVRDPRAPWVVVGWGDRDYFMAKRVTPWITLKAVCWPTESALHIAPLRKPPEAVYRRSDIVRLALTSMELAQLRIYLDSQFATDRYGHPVFLRNGFSAKSAFFLGSEKFYFPKMCNWWVADGLRETGIPLSRVRSITAHELMRQVKRYGVRTGVRQHPSDGF
ncbi:MAG: DUF2459 domain-containing protein [Verrucomicrobiaceae bacterium]|nr:MAG: DUF2459 domain-containing protein [Verrucomicrobiaceae bacterium]